jgi:4-diphosphocytidyl-2-C-methyl-D-erythritol kinase
VKQSSVTLPSFAKINWSLRILGKRPDGYHEVRTALQTISLHDDIRFERSEGCAIALSCEQPDIPTGEQNLIVRAAAALKKRYAVEAGARIDLEKRIPAKAGLGGGSSNAAISLLALAHLWDIPVTRSELLEIAATLGADVPFFLFGGHALATGTGAAISPLADSQSQHLVVITPNSSVATARAYAAISSSALTTMNVDPILSSSHDQPNSRGSVPWSPRDGLNNDFESVIFDIEPEIERAKEALIRAGALGALLAGSGSSVFGIFADQKAQQLAIDEIESEAGWRIFPCVTLSRNEYLSEMTSRGIHSYALSTVDDTGA